MTIQWSKKKINEEKWGNIMAIRKFLFIENIIPTFIQLFLKHSEPPILPPFLFTPHTQPKGELSL